MVDDKLTGKSAIDDYFSSLLFDTQVHSDVDESEEPVFRFARVDAGYELIPFWKGPLSHAQLLCSDLILMSFLKGVSGVKLRKAMLNSIKVVSGQ
jgi:hypothetical protein